MSPSPSQTSAPVDLVRKTNHSRHNSTTNVTPGDPSKIAKQSSPFIASATSKPVQYTCLIRLPFIRHGFEDPPIVQWDAIKDRALWKLISHASNSKDLDWEEMSMRFNVSLAFLLQQAAWLYERHFEGMKAQMKKLGTASIAVAGGTSPVSQADGAAGSMAGVGGVSMQRVGSKESRVQALSNPLMANRDVATYSPIGEAGSSPGTPRTGAPPISRTPSSATVTQSKMQNLGHSRPQPLQRAVRGSSGSERRPYVASMKAANDPYYEDAVEHEGPFASDSEEETSALARSRALRRAPLQRKSKPSMGLIASDGDGEEEDDDDGDSSGGYLPFAAASKPTKIDPAATLKGSLKKPTTATSGDTSTPQSSRKPKPKDQQQAPQPSSAPQPPAPKSPTSSASSAMQHQLSSSGTDGAEIVPRPGPISPRHRAQLASLSPRYRRENSEGSPSMGSSFSDLDDASVTQSALEDALLSNMRQGNFSSMASRMSSLRDALGR